jgi:hypothetical protein
MDGAGFRPVLLRCKQPLGGIRAINRVLTWVLGIGLFVFVVVFPLVRTFVARKPDPAGDLERIRDYFEVLQGSAGPAMTVTKADRSGTRAEDQYHSAARLYLVTLHSMDGRAERRKVTVLLKFIGEGGKRKKSPLARSRC